MSHPTHIVCPCNSPGMAGPCPYLDDSTNYFDRVIDYGQNSEPFSAPKVGWICPSCKSGIHPDQLSCFWCAKSFGTSTTTIFIPIGDEAETDSEPYLDDDDLCDY